MEMINVMDVNLALIVVGAALVRYFLQLCLSAFFICRFVAKADEPGRIE